MGTFLPNVYRASVEFVAVSIHQQRKYPAHLSSLNHYPTESQLKLALLIMTNWKKMPCYTDLKLLLLVISLIIILHLNFGNLGISCYTRWLDYARLGLRLFLLQLDYYSH